MLIGSVLEKTPAESAWQLTADRLADWVRTSWLDHKKEGVAQWEDTMVEDPSALVGLRAEGFKGLVGLDYIFKWWGAGDSEELSGVVDVIWKVIRDDDADGDADGVNCYRTWIRLAERDFILGLYKEEGAKRQATRAEFREAFHLWRDLFKKL